MHETATSPGHRHHPDCHSHTIIQHFAFSFSQMSQSHAEKDVNLSMADLNINKDHDTADASNVPTPLPQTSRPSKTRITDASIIAGTRSLFIRRPSYSRRRPPEPTIYKVHKHLFGLAYKEWVVQVFRIQYLSTGNVFDWCVVQIVDEMSRRLDNLEASIQASARSQNEESKWRNSFVLFIVYKEIHYTPLHGIQSILYFLEFSPFQSIFLDILFWCSLYFLLILFVFNTPLPALNHLLVNYIWHFYTHVLIFSSYNLKRITLGLMVWIIPLTLFIFFFYFLCVFISNALSRPNDDLSLFSFLFLCQQGK